MLEDIPSFDGNHNSTFYWICMMEDFLQTISSNIIVSHISFKFMGDALDLCEQLQESRIQLGQDEIQEWFGTR